VDARNEGGGVINITELKPMCWIRLDKGRLHVGAVHVTRWSDGKYTICKYRSVEHGGLIEARESIDALTAQCVLYSYIGDATARVCSLDKNANSPMIT
jgi:hypothetical protein